MTILEALMRITDVKEFSKRAFALATEAGCPEQLGEVLSKELAEGQPRTDMPEAESCDCPSFLGDTQ